MMAEFGALFDEVAGILRDADPMAALAGGAPPDQYEPQVETILRLLRQARCADDAVVIVHESFVRWYDTASLGTRESFANVAACIWNAYLRHRMMLDEVGGLRH